ncbi:nicotinate-nucleotide diphosphorylase [Ascobolus immersus RN42]|uniref:Nicotinate-nucleotide pyrophosphorylase [carboxylating] n=1 Tax=Ascobolus immersus RN42 TaxID=1160509 RepID=A0A3N4HJ00_ASCIM|nr:nicotinate-nucleotide diphosphorylase [Ascobolus immersus RN42]
MSSLELPPTDATLPPIPTEHGNLGHLLPVTYKRTIADWLTEDCPSFDYGGFVVGNDTKTATLYGKTEGVLAGVPFVDEIFQQLGCSVEWHLKEGQPFSPSTSGGKVKIATVTGPVRNLLQGERLALNILARCSGIATQSRKVLVLARKAGYTGRIAGTRKTTPGFRVVEKYGMLVGGVDQHRYDLSSMVMLKDNHIWARSGRIEEAVTAARSVIGYTGKIEVEVDSVEDAKRAMLSGADVVMLDNFAGDELKVAAKGLKEWMREENKTNVILECSGGLTEGNIGGYLCNEVDVYSTSSIHQSTQHVDYSLKIDH